MKEDEKKQWLNLTEGCDVQRKLEKSVFKHIALSLSISAIN